MAIGNSMFDTMPGEEVREHLRQKLAAYNKLLDDLSDGAIPVPGTVPWNNEGFLRLLIGRLQRAQICAQKAADLDTIARVFGGKA